MSCYYKDRMLSTEVFQLFICSLSLVFNGLRQRKWKHRCFPIVFFFSLCFEYFKMYSDNLKIAQKPYSYVRWCCHENNVDLFDICFISFCSLLCFFLVKGMLKRPFINIHHFGHEERNIILNRWAKRVVKFNSRRLLRIITSMS